MTWKHLMDNSLGPVVNIIKEMVVCKVHLKLQNEMGNHKGFGIPKWHCYVGID